MTRPKGSKNKIKGGRKVEFKNWEDVKKETETPILKDPLFQLPRILSSKVKFLDRFMFVFNPNTLYMTVKLFNPNINKEETTRNPMKFGDEKKILEERKQ